MNNPFFNEIEKNFGFGCMRLPMQSADAGRQGGYGTIP